MIMPWQYVSKVIGFKFTNVVIKKKKRIIDCHGNVHIGWSGKIDLWIKLVMNPK